MDRIDNQIKELEGMRSQLQRTIAQPAINQTFQLTPNTGGFKVANSIDEVNKELVFADSVFINSDFSIMWIKNVKGEVKTYSITELIEKDEKDLMIENLQKQIEELKGSVVDEEHVNTVNAGETKDS